MCQMNSSELHVQVLRREMCTLQRVLHRWADHRDKGQTGAHALVRYRGTVPYCRKLETNFGLK
jgi:hypothetical protein